jgi:hypothetical protein
VAKLDEQGPDSRTAQELAEGLGGMIAHITVWVAAPQVPGVQGKMGIAIGVVE